jgi:hypothetical protein
MQSAARRKISKQVDESEGKNAEWKMHLALRAVQFNFPNEEGSPGLHQGVHIMQRASLASVKLLLRAGCEIRQGAFIKLKKTRFNGREDGIHSA